MRRLEPALLALLLAAPARALKTETLGGAAAAAAGVKTLTVASGQALLRLSSGTAPSALDGPLAAAGAVRLSDLGSGWIGVGWSNGARVADKLAALKALPGVAAADPSRVYRPLRLPDDPLVNAQYALSQVNAPAAWEYETGASSRVTIAVVDSGIDGTQPDLAAKLTNTTSMAFNPNTGVVSADNPPTAACDHATRVAGVAAASSDNGLQVAGMSWGAQLVSYKVFRNSDCPAPDCSDAGCLTNDPGIVAAINQAVAVQNTAAYGHVVVNMSLGGSGSCPAAVQTAVTNAVAAGVVVVAAAGNDGGAVNNPGNCAGVIPMGATDSTNQVAAFSSRGAELASGGLVAPGVAVLTTDISSGTANATGTSFASPMGAGLAALVLSAKPALTPAQVQTDLRAGAEDVGQSATVQGAGRMNAYRSLRLAVKGTLGGFDGEQKPIAFPNPFRTSRDATVSFAYPPSLQGGDAAIKIYTMDGQFVREVRGLSWDGKNASGNPVASGAYVFVVSTGKGSARGRLAVIR